MKKTSSLIFICALFIGATSLTSCMTTRVVKDGVTDTFLNPYTPEHNCLQTIYDEEGNVKMYKVFKTTITGFIKRIVFLDADQNVIKVIRRSKKEIRKIAKKIRKKTE